MKHRSFLIYGGLLLALVTLQAGVLLHVRSRSTAGSLVVSATNAGVPVRGSGVRVTVLAGDGSETVVAEGRGGEPIDIPPGSYDVLVVYALANDRPVRLVEGVVLAEGAREAAEVDFTSGELEVVAETNDRENPEAEIFIYVYASGDDGDAVATLRPRERAILSAGRYDVRLVLTEASEEKSVQWLRDVVVEPGLSTRRSAAFRRGTLLLNATNAGRDLRPADVAFTVYRSGDEQLEEIEHGRAWVPLSLGEGSYDVKASFVGSNDRPERWLRNLEIEEGGELRRQVAFSSGRITPAAELEGGGPLEPYDVYVYYYEAGEHEQALAYLPAGETAVLSSGRYDLRASFYRSHDRPSLWLRGLELEPGGDIRRTIGFPSGRILLRAFDGEGEELIGDNVFVHLFAAGEHSRAVATARSGETFVVLAGTYDLLVEDTRVDDAALWLEGIELEPGADLAKSVTLP